MDTDEPQLLYTGFCVLIRTNARVGRFARRSRFQKLCEEKQP
jgi:hypothetical protein